LTSKTHERDKARGKSAGTSRSRRGDGFVPCLHPLDSKRNHCGLDRIIHTGGQATWLLSGRRKAFQQQTRGEDMTTRKLEKSEWGVFFNDLSKRLKDAQAEIEIASLKLGDQVQANWLPLFGVVYDPQDDIFEIALKGLDHLIRGPREVYVVEDAGKLVSVEIIDGDNNHQIVKLKEPVGAPVKS
jgi:Family of unknown function (DUF5335)